MKITIQYFDGCPHWNVAEKRLQSVLRSLGRDDVVVDHQLIETPEAAERAHFRGSPTILIEGHDPFAKEGQPFGLSCRVYETPDGPQGAPTETQLRSALVRRSLA